MADSDKHKKPGKPPKIKLSSQNGPKPLGVQGKDTARIDLSAAKTNLDSAKTDLESARADLSGMAKEDTTRIELPKAPPKIKPKSDTAKVDLALAKPPGPDDTARIDLPSKRSETTRVNLNQVRPAAPSTGKSETYRIELDNQPEDDADSEAPTRDVDSLSPEEREEMLKQSTMRVDLEEAEASPAGEFSPATSGIDQLTEEDQQRILKQITVPVEKTAARNQTARVNLEDARVPGAKDDTARIEAAPAAKGATPPVGTTRVEMEEEPSTDDDVFKRRGPVAGADAADAGAAVAGAGKPVESEGPPRSATARVSPPLEAEKSKTARIEVPAELASPTPGRPKTIRIKRADSTSGPVQAAIPEPNIKKSAKGKKKRAKIAAGDAEDVGTLYSVLALVSLIIVGIVVYVLLAQIFDSSLPWIGKVTL